MDDALIAAADADHAHEDHTADESVIGELRDLIAALRLLVDSEISYQKARAGLVGKLAAKTALWVVVALFFGFFVLMALVVGLLLALGQAIGPWWAMVAVAGGLLVAVGFAAFAILGHVRAIGRLFGEDASE
jgi:hypothetical protein